MTRTRRGVAIVLVGFADASLVGAGTAARRTVKRLPCPGPALWASTAPSCSSTSRWTSVRPMPSPPCARSRPRSPWTNRSKMCGSRSGRDSDARVLHLEERVGPVGSDGHPNGAADRRVLERVGEQVSDDLLEPHAVGVDPHRHRLDTQAMRLGLARRGERADRAPRDLGQIYGCAVQEDLAGHHAPHVEQVVDQSPEVRALAQDHVARATDRLVGTLELVQQAHGAADGAERVAQLVTQHGQELVLGAIDPLRLEQPRRDLPLDPLLVRDVAGRLGGADDPAERVAHRRHGERDLDERAVLAAAHGLEVVHRLSATDAPQDVGLLAMSIGRDDQQDGLADRLGRGIAEQSLGPAIPGGDDPVQRLADDGVVGGVHDRRQAAARLFRAEAVADVPDDLRGSGDLACRRPDGRHRQRHVDRPSVLGEVHRLEVVDAGAPPDLVQHGGFLSPALDGDDQCDRLVDGLGAGVAEQRLGGAVPRGDDAVQRGGDHRVRGRLDDRRGLIGGTARNRSHARSSTARDKTRAADGH